MYGLDEAGFSPTGTVHRNLGVDALYELGVTDDGSVIAVNPRKGSVTFRQQVDDPRMIKPYRDVTKKLTPVDEESADE